MDITQTELDKRNSDMDNIKTEIDECITDIGNARNELMSDMDHAQNELDKYIFDGKSNWNLLPDEIWHKIIKAVLQQSDFKANRICFTFATLNLVNKRFKKIQKCKANLPRIYCNPQLLSGVVLEIKWNSALLALIPDSHSWFIILNIFRKNQKRP